MQSITIPASSITLANFNAELARRPELAPVVGPDGRLVARYTVELHGDDVLLRVPDGVDKGVIDAAVARHDRTPPAEPPTRDEKLRAALEVAKADVAALIPPATDALIANGVKPEVAAIIAQALGGVAEAFAARVGAAITEGKS